MGVTTPLEVEVSKVSLGAWDLWENEVVGISLEEIGTTEEIVGVPLGDGAVEASLEISVAGTFLEVGTIGACSGDVGTGALGEREVPVGAMEAPSGDRAAGVFLEIGVTVVTAELHLMDWVFEFSLGAVVAGAFCKEEAISGSEVTASREGSARNSLGGEVLGAFLDDAFGLFEGEGGVIAGAALGDRAAGASLRATGIAVAFLREEGFLTRGTAGVIGVSPKETAISCVSAGMALGAVGAEAFCRLGGFSHGAVVTPSGDTAGISLGPAVLRAFWGKETVSSGAVVTPLEDGVEVSLGAAVLRDLLGDGIAEYSLGAAVFEVFLGERVISSGTAVTSSEDSFVGVSLGPTILGAFLGAEGISSGPVMTPPGDGTVGASLGPDILGAFPGEGVSSGPTETPLEGWAGISLGVDVLEAL